MPKLHGCNISIVVDGEALPEYATEIENINVVNCWVPSEAGKTFIIRWEVDENSPLHLLEYETRKSVSLHIDGKSMTRHTYMPPTLYGTIEFLRTGELSGTPFRFSPLVLTDDETLANLVPDEIGVISVLVNRTKSLGSRESRKFKNALDYGTRTIHEKSKKAGCRCVSLGPEIAVAPQKPTERLEYIESTFDTGLQLLQAMEIMPLSHKVEQTIDNSPNWDNGRKRSSDTVESNKNKNKRQKQNVETRDVTVKVEEDERVAVLQERMRLLQQEIEAVQESRRVKREVSPIQARFSRGEVIDLTDE